MTPRDLLRAHLPQTLPTLLADHTVVVLSSISTDQSWAVNATWEVARAAARGNRRVLLVDLSLEQPLLHTAAVEAADEGVVDAFLFETSLNHVARAQDVADLYFIGTGTMAPNPRDVWSSPRWPRLAKGFAAEGALLVLFVPVAALQHLNVPADGLILLADQGFEPESGAFPAVSGYMAEGTPLLGVVAERAREPRKSIRTAPALPRRRSLTPVIAIGVVLVAALIAGGYILNRGRAASRSQATGASPSRPRVTLPQGSAATAADPAAGDTLYYSIQIAAFNVLPQAMARAADLEQAGFVAPVTPVQQGSQGVWYRVFVGAANSAGAADGLLQMLRQQGLIEPAEGAIVRTPQAFALGIWPSASQARAQARGLRDRGIPTYIVPRPDGTARLYLGAFTGAEQAGVADSLLTAAGLQHTLVPRSGITP